jgi:2-methylthioadenine synthetase
MDLETKAQLISLGTVQLTQPSREGGASTAGPGAGESSIFFQSGSHMVRLSVVESSSLHLEMDGDGATITLQGRVIARGRMVEPLLHCPGQAYITISERCIYDCKFCAVPQADGKSEVSREGDGDGERGYGNGQAGVHLPDQRH